MSSFDVLSVGDIVTDAFIKLYDDKAHAYDNAHGKWLAMQFGTKIPYDHVEILSAVGNAANAAVSFARLGLNTGFVTNVGGDEAGRQMIHTLDSENVDHRFVKVNPKQQSNYHYVLWYKDERTILIKHEDYDYHWPHISADEMPKWIYFSSISEKALPYHDELANFLEANPDVHLAFQPGTFQMAAGVERLQRLYARTDVLALNREEAVFVTGGDYNNIHDLFDRLHAIGPKVVVISDGPDGAYASDGQNRLRMPIYPDPAPPKERTGAGDAFTSTFVAAIIKGHNIEGALQWAPINSMSVVQQTGAQQGLLTEQQMEQYLASAPDWYKPERF